MLTKSLSQLHANPRNPRHSSKRKLAMLKDALKEFGDLGGVIYNVRTSQLIGGHQRCEAYRNCGASQVIIDRTHEPPTATGTVREGYFMIGGERHSYREVDWPEHKAAAAGIAANKSAGDWDTAMLKDELADIAASDFDRALTMFSEDEMGELLGGALDMDQSSGDEAKPERYGVLVHCDSKEHETDVMRLLKQEGLECKATSR